MSLIPCNIVATRFSAIRKLCVRELDGILAKSWGLQCHLNAVLGMMRGHDLTIKNLASRRCAVQFFDKEEAVGYMILLADKNYIVSAKNELNDTDRIRTAWAIA